MAKRIVLGAVVLMGVLLVGCFYLWLGTASSQTQVIYLVSVDDPASGLVRVDMQVQPARRWCLDLFLRDTVLAGTGRVSDLQVSRDGSPLAYHSLLPGSSDFLRIWLGGSADAIEISYQVDPTWIKGDVPRSYLGQQFGYLRGMVTLYTPYTLTDTLAMLQRRDLPGTHAGTALLELQVPAGWNYLLPWADGSSIPTAELRNVYLPVGPLSLQDSSFGAAQFVLAQTTSLGSDVQQAMNQLLPALFEQAEESLRLSPTNLADRFVVSVFPEEPIHGGAAGINSLICSPEPETLAHEMFHWWNGHTLQFGADAEWIHEGFTVYYTGKLLHGVGYWSEADFADYLSEQQQGLLSVAPSASVNLLKASTRLKQGQPKDSTVVYCGGAIVAAWLDQQLAEHGGSLDQLWLPLSELGRQLSSADFFSVLRNSGEDELARQCQDYVNGRQPLPQRVAVAK